MPGRTHGQPHPGEAFAAAAQSQVDELAADLADRAYALARAAIRAARMPPDLRLGVAEQYAARDRFIYDLLLSRDGEEPDLFRRAEIMAMDLGRPRAVILVDRGPRRWPRRGRGRHFAKSCSSFIFPATPSAATSDTARWRF